MKPLFPTDGTRNTFGYGIARITINRPRRRSIALPVGFGLALLYIVAIWIKWGLA